MKRLIPLLRSGALALALAATATGAAAGCYADYKAKRDNPLKLQYGVIALPDAACASPEAAAPVIANRIATDGWTLLDVVSIFGPEGLDERKARAGDFYLRY